MYIANINLQYLKQNLHYIQSKPFAEKVIAMVKADAYGHGIVEVSSFLSKQGVFGFGVATFEEGIVLRESGITERVFLTGGCTWSANPNLLVEHHLTPLISSQDELRILSNGLDSRIKIHLDLDTGMGRTGLVVGAGLTQELDDFLGELGNAIQIELEGVCTHFSSCSWENREPSRRQIEKFRAAIQHIESKKLQISMIHARGSGASLMSSEPEFQALLGSSAPEKLFSRPGIALYGYDPLEGKDQKFLKPVMSLQSSIVGLKTLPKGCPVGYDGSYVTLRETQIALLSVGYGDGYSRLNSNQAYVIVAGQKAPVIGRVSMDLTTVDVTDIRKPLKIGQLVTVMGQEGEEEITAKTHATWAKTIPYEVLTSVTKRVERVYLEAA